LSGGMGMAPPDGTDLFAGAPAWIADPVLNPRAGTGRLSFCYWWQAGHWYRGGSPSAERCSQALPGVWTSDAAADILAGLAAQPPNSEASEPTASQREAATRLVTAAESGAVAPAVLTDLFPADRFDSDGALYQLAVAGLAAAAAEPMPEAEAISRVRQFVTGRDLDTTDYPLDQLVADRFSVGWMVYVPVPRGTIAIGRAVFYVGDDGVLEAASSSTAPTAYVADFEARYRRRNRLP
ncbi:MAG: hypothetical protein HOQ24_13575, partial [Mycobacteriaceae bacterium]|nr:hypothetical protein [Mycobacteriaceae bacterium]